MKRLLAIAGLVALVLGLCFAQQIYLNRCYTEMTQALDVLEQSCQAGEFSRAAAQAKDIENQWVNYEKRLSYFLDNSEISELGTALGGISKLATEESKEDLLSQISIIRVQFTHIKTANDLTLDSIF